VAGNPQAVDPLKRLIERRHPEHKRCAAEWAFLREAIEALPDEYAACHLFKHPKEDAQVYAARKVRAADHRHNLTRKVLETYIGYLFQQVPTKADNLPQVALDFLACADQDGRPAVELAKDIALWSADQGIVWVCVDNPGLPTGLPATGGEERPLSAAQERELGLAPYAYLVLPGNVLDGRISRGRIEWLLVKEDERDDLDPWLSSGEQRERWRLWEAHQWTLIEKMTPRRGEAQTMQYRVADQRPHKCGVVPFVPVRFNGGSGFSSPGLVAEIAHIDRAIFNKTSLVDEIHYGVTFPQLGYPYQGDLYEEYDDADGTAAGRLSPEGRAILTVGLHSVIPYSSDSGPPAYITPPSEPAVELRNATRDMVKLALALALLDGEIGVESDDGAAEAESGVARSYVFEKLNRRLAGIADMLQAAFRQILALVCCWMGVDPEAENGGLGDVPWDFPDSFEVRSLAQELADLAAILASTPPSPTLIGELWKRVAGKALPKAEADILETINDEIEAASIVAVAGGGGALADTDNYNARTAPGEPGAEAEVPAEAEAEPSAMGKRPSGAKKPAA
jgi:hypothetical protein